MRRRDFISFLGSTAAMWPLPGRAQQGGRLRRIGMLMGLVEGDPQGRKYLGAFQESLRALGWRDGQNVQIDYRATADLEGMQSRAVELISLGPELVVTYTTPATSAVRQATGSVPILFVAVFGPVGAGFLGSFSPPGRGSTPLTPFRTVIGWTGG